MRFAISALFSVMAGSYYFLVDYTPLKGAPLAPISGLAPELATATRGVSPLHPLSGVA